jgi:hypothetical protein
MVRLMALFGMRQGSQSLGNKKAMRATVSPCDYRCDGIALMAYSFSGTPELDQASPARERRRACASQTGTVCARAIVWNIALALLSDV